LAETTEATSRRPRAVLAPEPAPRAEPLLLLHGRRFDAHDPKASRWTSDDVHHAGAAYVRVLITEGTERLSLTPAIYLVSAHLEPRLFGGRELVVAGDHLLSFGVAARRSEISGTFGPLPPTWRLGLSARAGACVVSVEFYPLPCGGQ
jgi:hypothetical protein